MCFQSGNDRLGEFLAFLVFLKLFLVFAFAGIGLKQDLVVCFIKDEGISGKSRARFQSGDIGKRKRTPPLERLIDGVFLIHKLFVVEDFTVGARFEARINLSNAGDVFLRDFLTLLAERLAERFPHINGVYKLNLATTLRPLVF
ncbi:hypothetical protein SDC9_161248 [bioreactor metagenome]|uniref:Uncharacterized protein n=1 Tax=bioreactor metagenome TaxID=1076179 RepID=A0A645FK34_9ZZZZ